MRNPYMNYNVVEAREILQHLITMTASKRGGQKLANAAFYLGDQVWPDSTGNTVHHEVVELHESGMDWSEALAFCNID